MKFHRASLLGILLHSGSFEIKLFSTVKVSNSLNMYEIAMTKAAFTQYLYINRLFIID